jgi:hypothetical protein
MAGCPVQVYRPRQPKQTSLYRLVSEHWEEFKAVYEERFEHYYGPLRSQVIRVVEEYLKCGLLDWGFTRLFCETCRKSYFLAFSCKQRCLCPSCLKKRQVAFAQFATTKILENVPHRHANFTVPKRLRRHFHFDRKLLSKLARCAYQTLKQAIREVCGPVTPGAISVIHTAGAMMTFHPHAHLIVSSGGWMKNGTFVHAPPLDQHALHELFRHRVFRMLLDADAITPDVVETMLSWHHSGFDAFIGPEIDQGNLSALENLAQYIAKGPVSLQKLDYDAGTNQARYRSRNLHPRHGHARTFDPQEFLAELTAHIAQPYEKLTNYHGVYSNASRGKRRKVLEASQDRSISSKSEVPTPVPPSKKNWARLIKKIYEVDPLVCQCGGKLKPIALIDEPDVIYRILKHCDLLEAEQDARAPPEEPTSISCKT